MKCFSCGKNFEYEKYYGICPKCGCYNKQETEEEQHQELHDVYDGGYTHTEVYEPPKPVKRKMQGSSKFLIVSIVFFAIVFIGGTVLGMTYEDAVASKMQKELTESEVEVVFHESGESFQFQEMHLAVTDTCTLATDEDINLPEGKKLIAVKLEGMGNGEWESYNEVSDAYVRINDSCYWQVPYYEYEPYGQVYGYPAFSPYALSGEMAAEGWIAFVLDKEEQEFLLCLEERSGENQIQIDRIHSIPLKLKEDLAND